MAYTEYKLYNNRWESVLYIHCTYSLLYIRYSEKPFTSSLRDVAHDGWLCTVHLLCNSRWAASVRANGTVWKGRRYSPYKITTAGSLSFSRPGGPPCWANPLAFDLICQDTNQMSLTVCASTPSFCPLCDSGASVLCVHNSPMVKNKDDISHVSVQFSLKRYLNRKCILYH